MSNDTAGYYDTPPEAVHPINWRKKYGDLGASEVRRLRQLEEENARLKRVVADLTLDKNIFAGRHPKKSLTPTRRREIVQWIIDTYKVSIERACRLGNFSSGNWYRKSTAVDQSALRMRIRDIALSRPRFSYERIHTLLRREGWPINVKRVHRLYCLEGLQVRMRIRRKKRLSLHRGPAPTPNAPTQRWSMDFVHDQLASGRPFRVLTVIDNWSRESPVLEVGFRLTGDTVVEVLRAVAQTRKLPGCITVDHGTEFTSKALDCWAWENKVQLDFTRPGNPTDNGLCESFNGRLRDECLNVHEFQSLEQAKQIIENWRRDYNDHRPHGSLGKMTPSEYIKSQLLNPLDVTGF